MKADKIKYYLSRYYRSDKFVFLTEVKTGSTWFNDNLGKIDALAIKKSWTQPCINAFEVKVSRHDFLNDEKWPKYLDFCHRFYWVCPSGLIKADEIDTPCGLIWIAENGGLKTVKKALYRNITVPESMFYHLIISHTESDRHPFFSSHREQIIEFLQDKTDRKSLSLKFSNKLVERIAELEEQNAELKRNASHTENDIELLKSIEKIMTKHNMPTWNIVKDLDKRLSMSINPKLEDSLRNIAKEIEQLEILKKEEILI